MSDRVRQRAEQLWREHFVPLYPWDKPVAEMTIYEQGLFKQMVPLLERAIHEGRAMIDIRASYHHP